MVDYAVGLEDRAERQKCAEGIITIMKRMFPNDAGSEEGDRKLWDHLALMSNFRLDIDYPYDVTQAAKIAAKPEPMPYPMQQIPVRHYGKMLFDIFDRLKTMEPGEERDALARYTDGAIPLDLDSFKFEKISEKDLATDNGKKKRK